MEKQWKVFAPNLQLRDELSATLKINPIITQLLINRNITKEKEAQEFLSADMSHLHDPFLFKNMDKAIARINSAAENKERVLIFGDYDVDGVTSTTLLNHILLKKGIDVINFIPHRMTDGYGLNHEIAIYAKDNDIQLIITVDCGVTANAEVDTINAEGIDVIIIDHHEPSEHGVPNAIAVIDPKQGDCSYPFNHLASAGLVAKIAQALDGSVDKNLLDLVAIGTVADVAPLVGENRIFVKQGLPRINETTNIGLRALMDLVKIKGKTVKPYHVGFMLGPRINAAGRMDSAHVALDLFLSTDSTKAIESAALLEKFNVERQRMQRDVVDDAFDLIEKDDGIKNQKVIVVGKNGWHKGVVGIAASRIKDKYYRPAIVISIKDGVGTASARSIDGFHLHDVLTRCEEFLENYGGHANAAGLTIKEENIDAFRVFINEIAEVDLDKKVLLPKLRIDMDILLSKVDMDLADDINILEPYGEGNPSPIFCSYKVRVNSNPQVLGKNTLKFWLIDDTGFTISAVGFGMADYKNKISKGQVIDVAYQIAIDDWNKAPTAQVILKDIKL